jgi:hypothetical protein
MPERMYPDLAHLPPAEYRKESRKRREADRKEYHRLKYIKSRDLQRLEERKKELEEAIAIVKAQKEGVASAAKNIPPIVDNDNSGGVETI